MEPTDNRPEPDDNELRFDLSVGGELPDGLRLTEEGLADAGRALFAYHQQLHDGSPVVWMRITLSTWTAPGGAS